MRFSGGRNQAARATPARTSSRDTEPSAHSAVVKLPRPGWGSRTTVVPVSSPIAGIKLVCGGGDGLLEEHSRLLDAFRRQGGLRPLHLCHINTDLVLRGERIIDLFHRRLDPQMAQVMRQVPESLLDQDIALGGLARPVGPGRRGRRRRGQDHDTDGGQPRSAVQPQCRDRSDGCLTSIRKFVIPTFITARSSPPTGLLVEQMLTPFAAAG